jgi:hypothetical protein
MSESSHFPTVVRTEIPSSSPSSLLSTGASLFTTIFASGDTYIFKNGFIPSEAAGKEETMLIQNGPEGNLDIPDTYALVSFNFDPESSILSSAGSTTRSSQQDFKAKLCLHHLKKNSSDTETTTYSLCRIDFSSSPQNIFNVDNLNGEDITFSMPDDCIGKHTFIIDFDVAPDDTEICIDILGTLEQPLSSSGQNRHLTPADAGAGMVLFMIDNLYTEQQRGDRFYTRNSGGRSPKIILNQTTPGPTSPPQTTATLVPTLDVTIVTGQSKESDSNRNGLYSLLLLLLLIPVVWFAMKRYKRHRQNRINGNTMPSQVEYYLTNHELGENGFGDEEESTSRSEDPGRDRSICPPITTGKMFEGQYAESEGNSSRDESSEEFARDNDDSDDGSDDSTVDW